MLEIPTFGWLFRLSEYNLGQNIWNKVSLSYWKMLGNSLGTCSEPIVNLMGTHWEQQKSNTLPQKKKKTWDPWVHTTSPHWLQDFFFAYLCSLPSLA
jgi:hypothetical protein